MKGNQASLLMWSIIATLLSQNVVIPVLSSVIFQDQKNFFHFPLNPYIGDIPPVSSTPTIDNTPPTGSTPSPPQGLGGGNHGSTPSYGGTPPETNCPKPPTRGYESPIPTPPKNSSGGQDHHHLPSTTPTTPPSTTPTTPPPTTPTTPPSTTPSTPINTPSTPSTPGSIPSPPFNPIPFTGTCYFWKNHPQYIVAIFGWPGTLGQAFGLTGVSGFGSHTSILDLLSNNRRDAFGSLCREGTASLLNSMVNKNFPYSTKQVRDHFLASLSSEEAAGQQASLFKIANEG